MFQCFSVSLKQNACLGFVQGFCAGPILIGHAVLEKKIFENGGRRTMAIL